MAHSIFLPASFPIAQYIAEFQHPGFLAFHKDVAGNIEMFRYDIIQQGPVRLSVHAGSVELQPPGAFNAPETITINLDEPGAEVALLRHVSHPGTGIIGADDLDYECVGGQSHPDVYRFLLSICPVQVHIDISTGVRLLHVTFDNPPGNVATGYSHMKAVPQ